MNSFKLKIIEPSDEVLIELFKIDVVFNWRTGHINYLVMDDAGENTVSNLIPGLKLISGHIRQIYSHDGNPDNPFMSLSINGNEISIWSRYNSRDHLSCIMGEPTCGFRFKIADDGIFDYRFLDRLCGERSMTKRQIDVMKQWVNLEWLRDAFTIYDFQLEHVRKFTGL